MTLQVDFKSNHVVDALVNALGPEGRRAANSVAASAIKNAVQRHIRSPCLPYRQNGNNHLLRPIQVYSDRLLFFYAFFLKQRSKHVYRRNHTPIRQYSVIALQRLFLRIQSGLFLN